MQVHPVPVADEMPGEVQLLHRPPSQLRHLKFHGEFEQREPVPLGAVQQFGGGELGTPVPPVRLAARLGGGTRPGGFDADGDVQASRAMAEQVVMCPAVRPVLLSEQRKPLPRKPDNSADLAGRDSDHAVRLGEVNMSGHGGGEHRGNEGQAPQWYEQP